MFGRTKQVAVFSRDVPEAVGREMAHILFPPNSYPSLGENTCHSWREFLEKFGKERNIVKIGNAK